MNDPLPNAVEILSTTAYWYEPNLGISQTPASIQLQLYQFDQVMHASDLGHPETIRVVDVLPHLPPPNPPPLYIAGTTIRVKAYDVPVSDEDFNNSCARGDQSREVNVAYDWEDRARDDPEGPPASIQEVMNMRMFVALILVSCKSGGPLGPCESDGFSGAVYWVDDGTALKLDGYEAVSIPASTEIDFEVRWSGPPRRDSIRVIWTAPGGFDEPPGSIQDPPFVLSTAACDPILEKFRLPFQVTLDPNEIASLEGCVPAVIYVTVPAADRNSPSGGLESQFAGVLEVCAP